jgi:hypothetical protein
MVLQGDIGPLSGTLIYQIEEVPEGTTLTNTADLSGRGPLRLLAPLAASRVRQAVAANLDKLRSSVEVIGLGTVGVERAYAQLRSSGPFGGSYARRTSTCAAFAIRFPGWLSVRRWIVGGLLDGELGRRVCLQAFVRDGRAAADRAAVAAVFDPLESPIERGESVPQAGGHGVVDALLCQWLRRISRIAFSLMVICPGLAEIGQQLLHLRALRV